MYKGGSYVLEKEKMPGCTLLSPFCPACWDLVSMARRAPVSSPSDSGFGSWLWQLWEGARWTGQLPSTSSGRAADAPDSEAGWSTGSFRVRDKKTMESSSEQLSVLPITLGHTECVFWALQRSALQLSVLYLSTLTIILCHLPPSPLSCVGSRGKRKVR